MNRDFNYSYWELKQYFRPFDLAVVGSGIVGLSTAISFLEMNPRAKVLVLERGFLPEGASTKNAGFACFGSAGELLSDLKKNSGDLVWETVQMRWQGLTLLRKRLKDKAMDYRPYGGYELFTNPKEYQYCCESLKSLNAGVKSAIGLSNCYSADQKQARLFRKTKGVVRNQFEGQVDTGLMMHNLLKLAQEKGAQVLNNISVQSVRENSEEVEIQTDRGLFKSGKLVVATNGFAKELLKLSDIHPARAQVLITKPIKNLKIKGCYHFDEGYYYFRNIDNRILLGGARNLDFKGEATGNFGVTEKIQSKLEEVLRETVLHGTHFEIGHRWSGIMGLGNEKRPIIQPVGRNILAAVRMGGMGVAIGSWVGKKAAMLVS